MPYIPLLPVTAILGALATGPANAATDVSSPAASVKAPLEPPVLPGTPDSDPMQSHQYEYRRPSRLPMALMITGVATLGGAYIGGALYGVFVLGGPPCSDCSDPLCKDCQSAKGRLLVPVAGPWLAMPKLNDNAKEFVALLGVGQATGVLLLAIGSARHFASGPSEKHVDSTRTHALSGVVFGVAPAIHGAFAYTAARF